jgi:hypothetical protein
MEIGKEGREYANLIRKEPRTKLGDSTFDFSKGLYLYAKLRIVTPMFLNFFFVDIS